MKRHQAVPLLFAACSYAHAQSSVTLYGIVDLGITYANNIQTGTVAGKHNGTSQIAMSDGHSSGLGGSRWGFRGVEDLGGGSKAIFVLENGFFANTGALAQGGAEFGRQSYVGLASPTWGKITLGRQYDPYIESIQQFTATSAFAGYMGAHASDLDNLANTVRINNSAKFTTRDYSGFVASGLYSLGGVAGALTRNQVWALGAIYSRGPFAFGLGYLNARDPNVSFYGNTPNKGAATVNNIGSFGSATTPQMVPAYAGYASASSLEIAGVGAKYSWDATTLGLVVTNTRFSQLGSTEAPNPKHYTGNADFISAEINLRTLVTPSLTLGAAFDYITRNSVNGDGGAKYLQLDLGAIYSLSTRTDVYALSVLQRASGVDSLGQSAVASISGFSPSATNKQVTFRTGIRHKF